MLGHLVKVMAILSVDGRPLGFYTARMLKAIVFDFDGIVVDSEQLHYQAFMDAARPLGIRMSYDQYVDQLIGYDDCDAFRVMLAMAQGAEPANGPQSYMGDDRSVAQLKTEKATAFQRLVASGIEPIPGAVELIQQASTQMPLAISSGATRQDIDLMLSVIGLADSFSAIVSADDVARSKPDPQSYVMAVQALAAKYGDLDLQATQCLAIEDTAAGIEAARAAGLWALGVTTTSPMDRLHRAHRTIESMVGLTVDQLSRWFA